MSLTKKKYSVAINLNKVSLVTIGSQNTPPHSFFFQGPKLNIFFISLIVKMTKAKRSLKVEAVYSMEESCQTAEVSCQTEDWDEERMIKYRKMKRKLVEMITVSYFCIDISLSDAFFILEKKRIPSHFR